MNVRARLHLWRLQHRLRLLQDSYYDATASEGEVIPDYLRTLADARALYRRSVAGIEGQKRVRVHAGSGGHRLAGWINVDVDPQLPIEVAGDLARALPFRAASVDYIHSEDLLEHLDREGGRRFLEECRRVLKPGGTMRLLTPDLRRLVERIYLAPEGRHLGWCGHYLQANGPCAALNMHLRMEGEHRFIYDEAHLDALLRELGFRIRHVRYNRSPDPELRFLDLRDFGLSLFVEAVRET
jgi:predicted SAM-dependent methyltransferase